MNLTSLNNIIEYIIKSYNFFSYESLLLEVKEDKIVVYNTNGMLEESNNLEDFKSIVEENALNIYDYIIIEERIQ